MHRESAHSLTLHRVSMSVKLRHAKRATHLGVRIPVWITLAAAAVGRRFWRCIAFISARAAARRGAPSGAGSTR